MVKKLLFHIFIFTAFIGLFPINNTYALESNQEKIDLFDATVQINQDSSMNVIENISYNSGELSRHGIFRKIPIKYKARGLNHNLRISDITVTDDKNIEIPFEKRMDGKNIVLKIGYSDFTFTGEKTYLISYKIKRAINFFNDYDEIYWNATGNNWQFPILKSSAKVILPKGVSETQIKEYCYVGIIGSNTLCDQTSYHKNAEDKVEVIEFKQENSFLPGSGLTVAVGFPKGLVKEPGLFKNFLYAIEDNWLFLLPFITFIVLFYIWYTKGRDPEGRNTIMAQYDPPDNLTPAEVGAIYDESVDNKDISANIVNLAIRGFIKIKRIEKKGVIFNGSDYFLERLNKDNENNLEDFDQKIIDSLFSSSGYVYLSSLKQNFYNKLQKIKDNMYEILVLKGYFPKNPEKLRKVYSSIGAAGIIIPFFLFDILGISPALGIGLCGLMIVVFSFIMPSKTKRGVLAKEHILGFKRYLKMAEKDRINFHNAPEKNPQTFEKLLPFAMVLGVEKEWAKQFEGIYNQNSSWYEDSSGLSFNSVLFVKSMNSFSSQANDTLSSAPGGGSGSGGGGFSGGGFGGGGGGSW